MKNFKVGPLPKIKVMRSSLLLQHDHVNPLTIMTFLEPNDSNFSVEAIPRDRHNMIGTGGHAYPSTILPRIGGIPPQISSGTKPKLKDALHLENVDLLGKKGTREREAKSRNSGYFNQGVFHLWITMWITNWTY